MPHNVRYVYQNAIGPIALAANDSNILQRYGNLGDNYQQALCQIIQSGYTAISGMKPVLARLQVYILVLHEVW